MPSCCTPGRGLAADRVDRSKFISQVFTHGCKEAKRHRWRSPPVRSTFKFLRVRSEFSYLKSSYFVGFSRDVYIERTSRVINDTKGTPFFVFFASRVRPDKTVGSERARESLIRRHHRATGPCQQLSGNTNHLQRSTQTGSFRTEAERSTAHPLSRALQPSPIVNKRTHATKIPFRSLSIVGGWMSCRCRLADPSKRRSTILRRKR